jgi:hypothetical protein
MLARVIVGCVLLALPVFASAGIQQTSSAPHDKAYWQTIVSHEYKPPEGSSVRDLAMELNSYLGSPDPQLRDGFAYSILTAWMTRVHALDAETIRSLAHTWLKNIDHIDSAPTNAVLLRSFSTLMLSIVVARDNAEPFLTVDEFHDILNGALAYSQAETDLRGFDPRLGWIHATAHTADLLKFLARSRYITPPDQSSVLAAIAHRLQSAPTVFVYGEDERLARATLSVVLRKDFDAAAFSEWIKTLRQAIPQVEQPSETDLHTGQNIKNFLSKLDVILAMQPDQTPSVKTAQEAALAAVKNTF